MYGWLHLRTVPACSQRPQKVKVRAQNAKGETLMLTLNGWQARIFQHEYDHLQVTQQEPGLHHLHSQHVKDASAPLAHMPLFRNFQ